MNFFHAVLLFVFPVLGLFLGFYLGVFFGVLLWGFVVLAQSGSVFSAFLRGVGFEIGAAGGSARFHIRRVFRGELRNFLVVRFPGPQGLIRREDWNLGSKLKGSTPSAPAEMSR